MIAAQIRIRSASTSVRRAPRCVPVDCTAVGNWSGGILVGMPLPDNRTPLGKLALRKLGWFRKKVITSASHLDSLSTALHKAIVAGLLDGECLESAVRPEGANQSRTSSRPRKLTIDLGGDAGLRR